MRVLIHRPNSGICGHDSESEPNSGLTSLWPANCNHSGGLKVGRLRPWEGGRGGLCTFSILQGPKQSYKDYGKVL